MISKSYPHLNVDNYVNIHIFFDFPQSYQHAMLITLSLKKVFHILTKSFPQSMWKTFLVFKKNVDINIVIHIFSTLLFYIYIILYIIFSYCW